jgi:aryl-alcohol dehydrogenase-like predicted oxidoreductase
MKTVQLGETGEQVSALCLGAMYFGSRNNEATSYRMLDQYIGAGGTFIDTANIYAHWVSGFHGGESETLLGRWMRERGNRERLFIASKVGFNYGEVRPGLTSRQIETECEKSLRRMGVETIDLYYAHVDDPLTPPEETMEAFDRLVQMGKVRYVGASNYRAWRLEKARWISRTNGWAEFCCVQQRYTYLRPRPGASFDPQLAANDDLLDYVRREGVTLLAYSVLLDGAYTREDRDFPEQYRGPDADARLAVLRQVAAAHDATPNQIVLAWMLHTHVIPLIAASTGAQMQENLAALEIKLTDDEVEQLNSASA